ADDRPAELLGYGPISPERARRLAREAVKWTPVERDPNTAEILRVGNRRKVADGLKRFLRARDGTCRFPGCRTNALISE
ncbi:HNH endonuclease, partial [Leifsonia sp. SIMBA_070]